MAPINIFSSVFYIVYIAVRNTRMNAPRVYTWGPNTWFGFPENWENLLDIHCMRYVAQIEICPKTEREHLQFFVVLKNAKTFSAMQKIFPDCHLQVTNNRFAARQYCEKLRTAKVGSLREKGFGGVCALDDEFKDYTPYPWQQEILDLLETKPDRRTIHWYWEPEGNIGKSTLVRHILINQKGVLPASGKDGDIKHLIHQYITTNRNTPLKAVLMDLTRSREQFISYTAIEDIKNGVIVNTKYETAYDVFNSPHVVVFANWPPDLHKVSADRWKITRLRADDAGRTAHSTQSQHECEQPPLEPCTHQLDQTIHDNTNYSTDLTTQERHTHSHQHRSCVDQTSSEKRYTFEGMQIDRLMKELSDASQDLFHTQDPTTTEPLSQTTQISQNALHWSDQEEPSLLSKPPSPDTFRTKTNTDRNPGVDCRSRCSRDRKRSSRGRYRSR